MADPKSGVVDIDGAIQMGQRMIESGFVIRVSRELKAQEMRHFGRQQKAKREFRGGNSFYRFDKLAISPYLVRDQAPMKHSMTRSVTRTREVLAHAYPATSLLQERVCLDPRARNKSSSRGGGVWDRSTND